MAVAAAHTGPLEAEFDGEQPCQGGLVDRRYVMARLRYRRSRSESLLASLDRVGAGILSRRRGASTNETALASASEATRRVPG